LRYWSAFRWQARTTGFHSHWMQMSGNFSVLHVVVEVSKNIHDMKRFLSTSNQMRNRSGLRNTLEREIFHTLSTWARRPSWLLCRVVSLTSSFAWEANCSSSELWLPCLSTGPGPPALVGPWPGDPLSEPDPWYGGDPEPKLDVRAKTLPMLGCRWGLGLTGTYKDKLPCSLTNKSFEPGSCHCQSCATNSCSIAYSFSRPNQAR